MGQCMIHLRGVRSGAVCDARVTVCEEWGGAQYMREGVQRRGIDLRDGVVP